MDNTRQNCMIPSYIVPKCPVCGCNMTIYLRCDEYFVEDENWYKMASSYVDFLNKMREKKAYY